MPPKEPLRSIKGSDIAKAARTWIGTPFVHGGRKRGPQGGTDCVGLVIGVSTSLKLVGSMERISAIPYGWRHTGTAMMRELGNYLDPVDMAVDPLREGDIVCIAFRKMPLHVAIVGATDNYKTIIHAYCDMHRCVEQRLDDYWASHITHAFRYPGAIS